MDTVDTVFLRDQYTTYESTFKEGYNAGKRMLCISVVHAYVCCRWTIGSECLLVEGDDCSLA
jgi:hypothetical protein